MKRSKNTSTFYPAVLLISFFILVIVSLLLKNMLSEDYENQLTGGVISAEGGNVTYANTSKIDDSGFWQGYFGEITIDASASTPSSTAQG